MENSLKCGPFGTKVFNLYGREKFYMKNFAKIRTKRHFFVRFNSREKITAKVNAFTFPDGETDLNFQKGGL